IRELSTPALQVRDRLLILPIVGALDAVRARQLIDHLLEAIRTHRAKVVVIDVTGVPLIDTAVANYLAQTVQASRLMGGHVIFTGLWGEIVGALVALGADLSTMETMGDLQEGIAAAERLLGYEVKRRGSNPGPV